MKKFTPESMRKGYIVFPKTLLEERIRANGKVEGSLEALIMVLCHVNYSDTEYCVNNHRITCRRGESTHSMMYWSHLLRWSRSKTRRFFQRMVKDGLIEMIGNDDSITHIRVLQYDLWTCQDRITHLGHGRTLEGFPQFWTKYHETLNIPKVNIAKARREWKKMSADERVLATDNIEDYYYNLQDVRYCLQCCTYLTNKSFLNEY